MSDDPLPQQPEPPQQSYLLPPRWRNGLPVPASTWIAIFLWGVTGVAVALFVASFTGFADDPLRHWSWRLAVGSVYLLLSLGTVLMFAGVVGLCVAWRRRK